jgi:hypothetical protein
MLTLIEKIYNRLFIKEERTKLKEIISQIEGTNIKYICRKASFLYKKKTFELSLNPIILKTKNHHHVMVEDYSGHSINILKKFIELETLY